MTTVALDRAGFDRGYGQALTALRALLIKPSHECRERRLQVQECLDDRDERVVDVDGIVELLRQVARDLRLLRDRVEIELRKFAHRPSVGGAMSTQAEALTAAGTEGVRAAPSGPTLDEVRRWPASVDVSQGAAALGYSRSWLYELIKCGESPVRVITVRGRSRVLTASLVRLLETGDA